MNVLLAILLLGLNFFISWSNASYVGQYWSESKKIGGSFRAEIICGYAMAVAGFTMVYGYIMILLIPLILQMQGVDAEVIAGFQQLGADLIYLLVGGPIVLSGIRIWLSSLRAAWEQRTFSYVATAGWNSYAQIHNTISFARNAPSAFGRIVDTLVGSKKSSRSKKSNELIILMAILVVILAIFGGYFTADAIMKDADERYDGLEKAYEKHRAEA